MAEILVKDASFAYSEGRYIWQHVDLHVQEGDCYCILGANGCGKTTLFSCLNGDNRLKSGQILVNGKEIGKYSVTELARTVGIVFQDHTAPFPYTALEVVRMGRAPYIGLFQSPSKEDTEIAMSMLEELGIAHLAQKKYTQISGGERQLVLIARTLCQQPQIILFDEPTSHLDFKNSAMVINTIQRLSEKGMTMVMTSHFPNHVWKVGNKVALMGKGGMLACGPVEEIMTEENLEATYGVKVNILRSNIRGKETVFCEADTELPPAENAE